MVYVVKMSVEGVCGRGECGGCVCAEVSVEGVSVGRVVE